MVPNREGLEQLVASWSSSMPIWRRLTVLTVLLEDRKSETVEIVPKQHSLGLDLTVLTVLTLP